jgi:PAS domain S-box-containing protein
MSESARELLEIAAFPVVITTVQGGLLRYLNRAAERLFGFAPGTAVGQRGGDYWVEEDARVRYRDALVAEREVVDLEVLLRRVDGATFWGSVSANVTTFEGEPVVLAAVTDVTARRRAETRLRESERRYRMLTDNMLDVLWTLDVATGRFSYVSPSIERLRGLTVEEALAERVEDALTPESFARVQAELAKLGAGEEPSTMNVFDQPCRDGSVKHVEIATRVLRDEAGRPVEVLGVSRDATRRVEAQAARERLVEELRRALAEVKRLSGLIPICSYCKKVRDDAGFWSAVEAYVSKRSEAWFSHSICPTCSALHFPDED